MDLPLIIDVVFVGLILLFALAGVIKGFVAQLLGFVGGVVCFVLAIMLAGKSSEFLQSNFGFTDTLSSFYKNMLPNIFDNNMLNMTLEEFNNYTGSNFGIPQFILKLLVDAVNNGVPETTTVSDTLAPAFAYYTSLAIGFIAIFIVLRIIVALIIKQVRGLNNISVIKTLDKSLGFVLGAIKGLLTLTISIQLILLLPFGFLTEYKIALESTVVTKIFAGIDLFALITLGINPLEYIRQYLGL